MLECESLGEPRRALQEQFRCLRRSFEYRYERLKDVAQALSQEESLQGRLGMAWQLAAVAFEAPHASGSSDSSPKHLNLA